MSTGVNIHAHCSKGAFVSWHLNARVMLQGIGRLRRIRGLAARAMHPDVDMNLWLIDRHARRTPNKETPTSSPRIFHDCKQDYIETTATEIRDSDVKYTHTAAFFMEQLESLRNPVDDPGVAFVLAMTIGIWDSMTLQSRRTSHFFHLKCSSQSSTHMPCIYLNYCSVKYTLSYNPRREARLNMSRSDEAPPPAGPS